MTFDPHVLQIAVALIEVEPGRLVVAWNENWESFVLPLTKIRTGPTVASAEQAAVRAAAEALKVPCRVVPGKTEQLKRTLQLSLSDDELKDYHFTIVPVEVHPDFRNVALSPAAVVADKAKLLAGEYQPLSPSVAAILAESLERGWG